MLANPGPASKIYEALDFGLFKAELPTDLQHFDLSSLYPTPQCRLADT
jgi:hypothetical protein